MNLVHQSAGLAFVLPLSPFSPLHLTQTPQMSTHQLEARQRASALRLGQADILSKLSLNTLHIALYIRSDPPLPNDFHWAFYLHTNSPGGYKYHVRGRNNRWLSGHESAANILSENYLCVLIEIATIPVETHERLEQIMKSLDSTLNQTPGITCRTWLLMILAKLVEAGLMEIDVAELEKECYDFGNGFSLATAMNVQPRPLVKSTFASM